MLQFVFNFTTHPLDWSLFDNSTCKNKKSNGCSSTLQNEQNLQTADISVNDHVRALQSESDRRLCNISLARFSTVWKCSQIAFMKWALIDETPTLRPDDYHWQHCSGNANSDSGEPRWVTPWDVTREETIHLKHLNNVFPRRSRRLTPTNANRVTHLPIVLLHEQAHIWNSPQLQKFLWVFIVKLWLSGHSFR